MPTYQITDPTGVTHQIDGPDGASQDDVINAVKAASTPPPQDRFSQLAARHEANPDKSFMGGVKETISNMGEDVGAAPQAGERLSGAETVALDHDRLARGVAKAARVVRGELDRGDCGRLEALVERRP